MHGVASRAHAQARSRKHRRRAQLGRRMPLRFRSCAVRCRGLDMAASSPAPRATRDHHPSRTARKPAPPRVAQPDARIEIPDVPEALVAIGGREVRLTNLDKLFWPELRHHQARPAAVLRRRRARPAAAPRRSRDGDEALPQRRRRRVLLHEARARRRGRSGSRPARSSTRRATSSTSRWSRTWPRCCGSSTSAAST